MGGLIVSGISNRWLLVGSIHALFTTRYGWLLLVKLAAFGVLVGLGARNRFVIKTKLTGVPTDSDLLAQLGRNVICEACLGLAVVAIVACLGVTPPAGDQNRTEQNCSADSSTAETHPVSSPGVADSENRLASRLKAAEGSEWIQTSHTGCPSRFEQRNPARCELPRVGAPCRLARPPVSGLVRHRPECGRKPVS